mgnify:FL=1
MASNVANTQGERAASATANRWTTRDVLTFVIFNIVIIVATMVVKLAEDAVLSPQNTFFVGSWLFPLVSTPFYLVMADRIGKRGVAGRLHPAVRRPVHVHGRPVLRARGRGGA